MQIMGLNEKKLQRVRRKWKRGARKRETEGEREVSGQGKLQNERDRVSRTLPTLFRYIRSHELTARQIG